VLHREGDGVRLSVTDQIRERAESDLIAFIRLVAPHRYLGAVHEELISWMTRQDSKSHQLILLPRDHMKSALMAYRVAWAITRDPTIRVLYISSTANLAEKQLKMIKDILTSRKYRQYWPEMVLEEEGLREKWTQSEIAVDHPKRKAEGIRDSTIFTGGLTTSLTGLHCDIAVLDDVVVQENAYSEEGREKVEGQYSLLASIEAADAKEWAVGTRYHSADLYQRLIDMAAEVFDADGNVVDTEPVYEVFHRQVEDKGDGTGEYLWPRASRPDGKYFGFNKEILAKKKAQYLDKSQFYAQYYNDPNRLEDAIIKPDRFQYYDKTQLTYNNGKWFCRGKGLNIVAAADLAYTTKRRSDFTAIVVIGLDHEGFVYVLDIDRFKTDKISEMYDHIRTAFVKWGFRKLRIEITAAQSVIVQELKNVYLRPEGLNFSIDEFHPPNRDGAKEERMDAVLQPRYENLSMWHYKGGNCSLLEEELVARRPPHDDIKDALSQAIEIGVPPVSSGRLMRVNNVIYHGRFGGVQ
jgi:phage terminase large subunit-like protein